MDPDGVGTRYWQNTFLAMSAVSFVSCVFYADALRRIRKTISDQHRIETNEKTMLLHLCVILIYFCSLISKSFSEQRHVDAARDLNMSEAKKTTIYNQSLCFYTATIWFCFFFQAILIHIVYQFNKSSAKYNFQMESFLKGSTDSDINSVSGIYGQTSIEIKNGNRSPQFHQKSPNDQIEPGPEQSAGFDTPAVQILTAKDMSDLNKMQNEFAFRKLIFNEFVINTSD